MTYVISDIHGRFDKYKDMLEHIGLSDGDELYVIGDVVDRGPDGIRILQDIMERPNVHMLLGNHELMMLRGLDPMRIVKFRNLKGRDEWIGIDCGCSSQTTAARLSCLRLEDMKEYYV